MQGNVIVNVIIEMFKCIVITPKIKSQNFYLKRNLPMLKNFSP